MNKIFWKAFLIIVLLGAGFILAQHYYFVSLSPTNERALTSLPESTSPPSGPALMTPAEKEPSARNRDRGQAGHGYAVGKHGPIHVIFHRQAVNLLRENRLRGERRDRNRWCQEQIVLFEECPYPVPQV